MVAGEAAIALQNSIIQLFAQLGADDVAGKPTGNGAGRGTYSAADVAAVVSVNNAERIASRARGARSRFSYINQGFTGYLELDLWGER